MTGTRAPRQRRPRAPASRVAMRLARGGRHDQAFVVGRPPPAFGPRQAVDACWREVADALAARGVQPLQERVYGRLEAREAILAARRSAFLAAGLDPTSPVSFHQGLPIERDEFAGVQVWGVVPRAPDVSVVTTPGGRLWQGPDWRVLHLSAIGADGSAPPGAAEAARAMLAAAERAVVAEGFRFEHVRRTWITLHRILDWYDAFNAVRSACFAARGIGRNGAHPYPASTGIGATSRGEPCALDLLAVDGAGARVTPILATSRQGGASAYGSAFSRGMRVGIDGVDLVLVSGTASIDRAGASVHQGQAQAQVIETLCCVAAVLEACGAGLPDVAHATLFCKSPEVLTAYREVGRLLGLPELPAVPVVADVCRPELLVEIEAIAVVPAAGREVAP